MACPPCLVGVPNWTCPRHAWERYLFRKKIFAKKSPLHTKKRSPLQDPTPPLQSQRPPTYNIKVTHFAFFWKVEVSSLDPMWLVSLSIQMHFFLLQIQILKASPRRKNLEKWAICVALSMPLMNSCLMRNMPKRPNIISGSNSESILPSGADFQNLNFESRSAFSYSDWPVTLDRGRKL